jgi:hypothetical protein
MTSSDPNEHERTSSALLRSFELAREILATITSRAARGAVIQPSECSDVATEGGGAAWRAAAARRPEPQGRTQWITVSASQGTLNENRGVTMRAGSDHVHAGFSERVRAVNGGSNHVHAVVTHRIRLSNLRGYPPLSINRGGNHIHKYSALWPAGPASFENHLSNAA